MPWPPTFTNPSSTRYEALPCLLVAYGRQRFSPRAAQALDIDYTLTGLTTWNGGFLQDAQFDPTPDHPFQITFNLNDALPPFEGLRGVSSEGASFSGISPTGDPPLLSVTGGASTEIGGTSGVPFSLDNPAIFQGEDLQVISGGPPFRIFFTFFGPALFHYANGQATFETGTFSLSGNLSIYNVLGPSGGGPLVGASLTAQSVPVPEGASWLLAASAAAGIAGAYGVRRWRLRPAPSTRE